MFPYKMSFTRKLKYLWERFTGDFCIGSMSTPKKRLENFWKVDRFGIYLDSHINRRSEKIMKRDEQKLTRIKRKLQNMERDIEQLQTEITVLADKLSDLRAHNGPVEYQNQAGAEQQLVLEEKILALDEKKLNMDGKKLNLDEKQLLLEEKMVIHREREFLIRHALYVLTVIRVRNLRNHWETYTDNNSDDASEREKLEKEVQKINNDIKLLQKIKNNWEEFVTNPDQSLSDQIFSSIKEYA